MYVVAVELTIASGAWDTFLPLLLCNAARSRADEPGCRQFDVCVDDARPGVVFLYERYDDHAAFLAHRTTPHFLAFAEAAQPMIEQRRRATWKRVDP